METFYDNLVRSQTIFPNHVDITPALETIEVSNASSYTEGDVRELALKGDQIGSLILEQCPETIPTSVVVELFSSLTNAHTLIIGGRIALNDDCVEVLCRHAWKLKALSLDSCNGVSLEMLKRLSLLPELEQILLSLCPEGHIAPLLDAFNRMGIDVTVNGYR